MFEIVDVCSSLVRYVPKILTGSLGGYYTEKIRSLPPLLEFLFTKGSEDCLKFVLLIRDYVERKRNNRTLMALQRSRKFLFMVFLRN